MKGKIIVQNLETDFQSAVWKPVTNVQRPFVRHRNPEDPPGAVWRYLSAGGAVWLSVIIPTYDADRGGHFQRLLAQIQQQDFMDFEVIAVRGDPRQGRAINTGAALAKGKYLLTLDDDSSLPDKQTFRKLIAVMDEHADIGMAAANNTVPKDASRFVRRVMCDLPRRSWEPVREITDSDLVEHGCMIMRAEQFKATGGENELLPRGLDPYLREAFRDAGLRVVLVPDLIYHHLPPDNLRTLLRQFFRNGSQAAYVNRHYPQWVIETPSQHGSFTAKRTLPARVFRFPCRLLKALLSLKLIWFSCEISYALGFAFGYFRKS